MSKRVIAALIICLAAVSRGHAGQSIITDTDGYACMGDDKSRKETEKIAVNEAKRKASEYAATYIKSETHVKDSALEKDLISAYARAQVRVIQELEKGWYKEAESGDCYKVKLKVEVLPDERAMANVAKGKQEVLDDPAAPLRVKIWSDRKDYRKGDRIRFYLKGNKPFYARIVYREAGGKIVQLLPNPFRSDSYFNGGSVYELPSGNDKYDLEVAPPFGAEAITVYASTAPQGAVSVQTAGAVFDVNTRSADIPLNTRGIKLTDKGSSGNGTSAAEFFEAGAEIRTRE